MVNIVIIQEAQEYRQVMTLDKGGFKRFTEKVKREIDSAFSEIEYLLKRYGYIKLLRFLLMMNQPVKSVCQ